MTEGHTWCPARDAPYDVCPTGQHGPKHGDTRVDLTRYGIEGLQAGTGARTSYAQRYTIEEALERLDEARAEHPEYTHWYLLRYEPIVRHSIERVL